MAAGKLQFKIVTPERVLLDETVDHVTLPTMSGEITVLPNHIPLVTQLSQGDIVAVTGDEFIPVAVVGGFARIDGKEVAVLADFAEHVSELSDEAIEQARKRAEDLKRAVANKEIIDTEHFAAELARSITRASVGSKWKSRRYRK
jgi:F-type H+-transporting ATPase subunit epsilon